MICFPSISYASQRPEKHQNCSSCLRKEPSGTPKNSKNISLQEPLHDDKSTTNHYTCGQKQHLRISPNLKRIFALRFLENRAFLKTTKPLELSAEMSPLGLQKASKIATNRALEKHFLRGKQAKTLYLWAKTALSNFPKPQKK